MVFKEWTLINRICWLNCNKVGISNLTLGRINALKLSINSLILGQVSLVTTYIILILSWLLDRMILHFNILTFLGCMDNFSVHLRRWPNVFFVVKLIILFYMRQLSLDNNQIVTLFSLLKSSSELLLLNLCYFFLTHFSIEFLYDYPSSLSVQRCCRFLILQFLLESKLLLSGCHLIVVVIIVEI